jgi:DNA-binding LacI/PurR family transcriptional regulator
MAVFPLGIDGDPGRQVGKFLFERGHRSVAVFSFSHAAYENRFQGMRHLFHSAGVRMREFWVDFPTRYSELLTEKYRPMNEKYVEAERKMREMDAWLGGRFEEYTHIDRTFVDRALTREFAYETCRPFFEQALADPSTTAWVGGNDAVALAALRFLRGRSVDVPGRISVMGFDNHYESFAQGLSSFDFNGRAATIAMISHIMRPPPAREKGTRIHYTPGIVIERSSTRVTG